MSIVVVGCLFAAIASIAIPHDTNNASSIASKTIVPIEDPGGIYATLRDDRVAERINMVVNMVRAAGYRCDSISALSPLLSTHVGFNVYCNEYRYRYNVSDMGGHYVVTQ